MSYAQSYLVHPLYITILFDAMGVHMDRLRLLLRPAEVAEAVGVSRAKAYELIAAGQIPSVKLGGCIRVPLAALEHWIAQQIAPRQNPITKQ
jgi:excisionase family DNA binding protein